MGDFLPDLSTSAASSAWTSWAAGAAFGLGVGRRVRHPPLPARMLATSMGPSCSCWKRIASAIPAGRPTLTRSRGGVESMTDGVPQAYHVSEPASGLAASDRPEMGARAGAHAGRPSPVLHLFERTRPELTRGMPYLATVIEHSSSSRLFDGGSRRCGDFLDRHRHRTRRRKRRRIDPIVGETDPSLNANEVKFGKGAMISLAPGETFTSFNPSRPNANFDPFVQAFCREIGVALELPTELLLKHFTASYSASRAALEMAWQTFRKNRSWLAGRFCQPLYEWMMEEAVASGRLNRPGFFNDPLIRAAYCGAEWIGPQRASLNPYQEAQADALDIERASRRASRFAWSGPAARSRRRPTS
jgi:capsid protein